MWWIATTNTVTNRVPIGKRPNNVAITADGRRVYVCIRGESWVDIVDTASLEKVKSVEVGKGPHNIYRTPDGKEMIATSMDGQKLTIINIKTEEPEYSIPTGGIPRPVIIDANPDGSIKRLFVQLSKLHGVETIDWKTRQIAGKIMLPPAPPDARPLIPDTFSHGMAISPDHKTLWVDSLLNNSVTVFSMPDLKMITTIPIGRGPDWMVFTPGWEGSLHIERRREFGVGDRYGELQGIGADSGGESAEADYCGGVTIKPQRRPVPRRIPRRPRE